MKNLWIKVAAATVCIIAFFMLLGVIGDYDYTSQVVYNMSYEDYEEVKGLLTEQNGQEPSEREIAHYWVENHQ